MSEPLTPWTARFARKHGLHDQVETCSRLLTRLDDTPDRLRFELARGRLETKLLKLGCCLQSVDRAHEELDEALRETEGQFGLDRLDRRNEPIRKES